MGAGHLWLLKPSGFWLDSYAPAPPSSQGPGIYTPNCEATGCWHCCFAGDEQRHGGCWDLAKVSQEVCGGCSGENSLKDGGQPPSTLQVGKRAKTHTDSHVSEQRQSLTLGKRQVHGDIPSSSSFVQLCLSFTLSREDLIWEVHGF